MHLPDILLLILLAPLFAAGLIWLFARRNGHLAAALSVGAAGIIVVASLYLLFAFWDGAVAEDMAIRWVTLGEFSLSLGFSLNMVSATMIFVVSLVGFLIHIFSLGYMANDANKGRFFGGLSIFMFSMLAMVLSDNLFMLFVFWELVGFSSYMLIGHYMKKGEAAEASKKAFIVNRVGDFGLLIGIILVFWTFGTTQISEVAAAVGAEPELLSTIVGLLLFCGVAGKSAQLPLHVWLPDAMAGPTPISALIHAATMAAAGVFLVARLPFLFTVEALTIVAWIGVTTALSSAIWAFGQTDIKKILAYSTLSQLGFMIAGFGFGTLYGTSAAAIEAFGAQAALFGVGAALFHMTTHAFFKALLFLGAGSVIHACHHEQDIYKMGGLLKKMPITGITFGIGVITIAAVPFVASGFFSKDAILYMAKLVNPIAFGILVAAALLTATYMGRLFVVVFLGKPRSEAVDHAHETSWVMWLPLVVLAVFSVFAGYVKQFPLIPATLHQSLYDAVPHPTGSEHTLLIIVSAVVASVGLLGAFLFYRKADQIDPLQEKAYPLWVLAKSRFYFDEIYNAYVAKVQQRLAEVLSFLDALLISGLFVRGSAGLVGVFGILARTLHTGNVHTYVWWFFAGLFLFSLYAFGLLGG
jgi:NADH-quinone oxidoreductase subunit L